MFSNHQYSYRTVPAAYLSASLLICLLTAPLAAQDHTLHQSASAAASTPASTSEGGQIVLGDVVPFGSGTARSWVDLGPGGVPTAIGITMTEAALEGLPTTVTPGLIWMVEYVLDLPDAAQLPFDHIGVNWNPRGHMPSGVYNVPHFDFHFYTISPDERQRITARGEDLERCRKAPVAGMLPEGFVFAPESEEPGMGGHWADPNAHEFHGQDFTTTFIYGSHDGGVIFWEPMITKAYLETKPDVAIPLTVPQTYGEAGYYPTRYSIRYDDVRREYTISLDGLVLRPMMASN